MSEVKHPEITVKIIGKDGNAFCTLGACTQEMRRHELPQSEIDEFISEATAGNYDNLLAVVANWFEVE